MFVLYNNEKEEEGEGIAMPQTSLYMDDATMELIRVESARRGVSLSRFIAGAVNNYANHVTGGWPAGYWENVCGCLSDEDAEAMYAALDPDAPDNALDTSLDDDCAWFSGEA